MKLHREAPGYYISSDGRWEIIRLEEGNYRGWWIWRSRVSPRSHYSDPFMTKWEALESLEVAIEDG